MQIWTINGSWTSIIYGCFVYVKASFVTKNDTDDLEITSNNKDSAQSQNEEK